MALGCGPAVTPQPGESDPSTSTGSMGSSMGSFTSAVGTTGTPPSDTTAATLGDPDTSSEDGNSFIAQDVPAQCSCECDLWAQDCPADEKCSPWSNDGSGHWNATRCSPIADEPGAPGDPCVVEGSLSSGMDDCEQGAVCWYVDPDTLEGTCVPLCTNNPDDPMCPQDGQWCFIGNEGAMTLCLDTCNPLMSECGEGQACMPDGMDGPFVCASTEVGAHGTVGDECFFPYDCEPGFVCAEAEAVGTCDPGSYGCCTPVCDVMAPVMCPDMAQSCQWWFEIESPPGYENVGFCGV